MLKANGTMPELEGDVVLRPIEEGKPLVLEAPGVEGGRFGANSWWVPLDGARGLKVYVKGRSENMDGAREAMEAQQNLWLWFNAKVSNARKYVPNVHGFGILKHFGRATRYNWLRGRGGPHWDEDFPAYYACVFVERCEPLARDVRADEREEMLAAFAADGVTLLERDSGGSRQYGLLGGQLKFLDITGPNGEKYL